MIMAVWWSRRKDISESDAELEIKSVTEFEHHKFATHINTSVEDIAKTLAEYFVFTSYRVVTPSGKEDLIELLKKGNVLIVPAYGRALRNPHYTPPGPIPHALVVSGYDPEKKEFITNDPGTKFGEKFRYPEDVLYDAIWAYPSTELLAPPAGEKEKRVIAVWRE